MNTPYPAPRVGASLPRRRRSVGFLTIFIAFAVLLPVACQRGGGGGGGNAAPAASSTTTWAKTYGHDAIDRPESLVAAHDGTALVCGGGSRAYLIRADEYGDPLWSQLWSTGEIISGMGAVSGYGPTLDGGYVAWGRDTGAADQAIVLRLDPDGNLLWTNVLDGIGESLVGAVAPQGESFFATTAADDRVEFVALDGDGNLVWSSTPSGWAHESPTPLGALAVTSDGNVLFAGRLSSKELLFCSLASFDGSVRWTQTFAHDDGDSIRFHELRGLDGDEWSLAIEREDAITSERNEMLFRGSTLDGGLLDITTLAGAIAGSVSWVSRLADGGALVVGSELSMDGVETAMAHRFDSAGALAWSQPIVDPDWNSETTSRTLHAHELDDGAILVRGEFEAASLVTLPTDLFVARIEPDGSFGSLSALNTPYSIPTRAVAHSPNPGNSYLLAGSVTRRDSPDRPYPWFMKIDSNLQSTWERAWSTSYSETVHSAIENLTDDGFVVCGSSDEYYRRDFPARQPVIFEVDASGSLRWALTPAYPEPATALDLVRTGTTYHCLIEVGYSQLALLEIGPDGSLLDDRTLAASSGNGEDLVATPSAFWLWKTGTLIRIDRTTGSIEAFSVTDGDATSDSTFSLRSIAAVGDGLAILATFESDFVIAHFDANLDQVWAWRHEGGFARGQGHAIASGPDGSVWVAGRFSGFESEDMWVIAFESSGVIRHQTRYASLAHESARKITVGADGSALVGGTTALLTGDPEGSGDQWIIRVDSLGRVASSCPEGVGVPTSESFVPMSIRVDGGPPVVTTPMTATPLAPTLHVSTFDQFETTSQCVGVTTPQLTSLTLHVEGMGTVTNADPAVDCSGDCWLAIPTGSTLDLVATPDPGWLFAGWSGDYSGSPIVAVDSVTITAMFTAEPAGPPITISDSMFDPSDWAIEDGESGDGTETDEQVLGANPYRKMRTELPAASLSYRRYLYTAFEYDPSRSGAIRSLDFSERRRQLDSMVPPPLPPLPLSASVGGAFVLVQDGRVHEVTGSVVYDADWTTLERVDLEPSDFTMVGGVLPDFSANGGKIRFGYRRLGHNLSDEDAWFEHAIDDWTVTIHR